jgi:hypothetical protein
MLSVEALIAQAYPSPEWAVFFEVSNATGFHAKRRADAVALGIWPSRGNALIGFEVKTDRRDWLREKKNPEKADAIASHCDAWYMVTTDLKIAPPDELPDPWGLYVANKDRTRLKLVKPTTQFPDRDKSVMRRTFVAAMLRKVGETTVPAGIVNKRIEEAVAAAVAHTHEGRRIEQLEKQVERYETICQRFEEITGLKIDGWDGPEKIGAAVKTLMHVPESRAELETTARRLTRIVEDIQAAVASWPDALTRRPRESPDQTR